MNDNPIPNVSEAEGQSADIMAGNIDKLKEIFPDGTFGIELKEYKEKGLKFGVATGEE